MNFGRVIRSDCVNQAAPPDPRCSDPAFQLANPQICPIAPRLIIKPSTVLTCVLGSVQFRAFVVENNQETDVTDQSIFRTSNPDIALVGASSGNATGLGAGVATISATYGEMMAFAHLTVLAGNGDGDCCGSLTAAIMVLVDNSRSMSQVFNGAYATKLVYAKFAANRFIEEVNESKDTVGLIEFSDTAGTTLAALTSDKDSVAALVPGISQTQDQTAFYAALVSALESLDASGADLKIIMLISDGEDQTNSYLDGNNPIALLSDFKSAGGVVMCLGVRAHDKGYNLLEAFSTGGFFLNGYDATAEASLDFMSGLKGYLCAGNCVPAGDEVVGKGAIDYTGFINWDVVGGSVDLQGNGFFDFLPGHGLYVDLAGTTSPQNGKLVSKTTFALTGGHEYRLSVDVAGNNRQDAGTETVRVRVYYVNNSQETSLIDQLVSITDWTQGFKTYPFTFAAPADLDVYISIQQDVHPAGEDVTIGPFLNRVQLRDMTDLIALFDDDFDDENQVYIPPRCGPGSYGGHDYFGYDCYGTGCLDNPPPVQLEDPEQLPDIESGFTPPGTFTSTKTACATCPGGSTNNETDTLIPQMTGYTTPSGTVIYSADTPTVAAWKAFDRSASTRWTADLPAYVGYTFTAAKTVTHYEVTYPTGLNSVGYPSTWTFEASDDGVTWVVLDTRSGISFFAGETKAYNIVNPTAYLYYRMNISDAHGGKEAIVGELAMMGTAPTQVCKEASASSTVSQSDADNKAYAAALALAQSELNCQHVYTSTQQYTASCDVGAFGQSVTKSATRTSLVSQEEADAEALDAARTEAQAALSCSGSNNTQKITINDRSGVDPATATPYPSVKFLSGFNGLVTKVTVTLKALSHTHPSDIGIFLRAPNGATCLLLANAGGATNVSAADITFDDSAGTQIPSGGPMVAGTFQCSAYPTTPNFPSPAPAGPYGATLAALNGIDPNGSWSLWVVDDTVLDSGQIANGWDLTIST